MFMKAAVLVFIELARDRTKSHLRME